MCEISHMKSILGFEHLELRLRAASPTEGNYCPLPVLSWSWDKSYAGPNADWPFERLVCRQLLVAEREYSRLTDY